MNATRMVCARSDALMPVVTRWRASMLTVKAVRSGGRLCLGLCADREELERRLLERVGNEHDVELAKSDVVDGEADPTNTDRPLLRDVPRELGGERKRDLARRAQRFDARDLADPIYVAGDDV